MICIQAFTGVIDGKEVAFAVGAKISAADAKELGLTSKPELAQKDAPVAAQTKDA